MDLITVNALKRFYRSFRGSRVTVIIISILIFIFILGLVIPQKKYYPSKAEYDQWLINSPVMSSIIESLRLNDIYMSPITIFFLGLFFINLIVVIGHRVPVILRRTYLIDRHQLIRAIEKSEGTPGAFRIMVQCEDEEASKRISDKAARYFKEHFWSVIASEGASSFTAVRNRFSPFGFLLFHISFILCLIGGLLVMYTRFSGNLTLTEGEEFRSDIKQFRKIIKQPTLFRELPELGLTLLKVSPRYEGTVGVELDVKMKVRYYSERYETETRVNEPIKKGGISILPLNVGISPLFILKKRGGDEITGGYFSLNIYKGDEDSFEFPDVPFRTFVNFYPDFKMDNGSPVTRSLEIKNPVFRLRVEKEGVVLYDDFRKPGEMASFGEYELYCRELRYWVDFLVVREYGHWPLFAGFIAGAIGLIMRLLFFQKTVSVYIERQKDVLLLSLAGRSEYYQQTYLSEDLPKIGRELASYLGEVFIIREVQA